MSGPVHRTLPTSGVYNKRRVGTTKTSQNQNLVVKLYFRFNCFVERNVPTVHRSLVEEIRITVFPTNPQGLFQGRRNHLFQEISYDKGCFRGPTSYTRNSKTKNLE